MTRLETRHDPERQSQTRTQSRPSGRLIKDGIAAGDRRRATSIDHVTARRIAPRLLPGAMDEPFLRGGLTKFA